MKSEKTPQTLQLPQTSQLLLQFIADLITSNTTIEKLNIVGLYIWGSRLYDTQTESSDYDIIAIVSCEYDNYIDQIHVRNLNLHIMSEQSYRQKLNEHDILAIECHYIPHTSDQCILYYPSLFTINTDKLRRTISRIASNSWVKAKKKIAQGDVYVGLKSLFHSMRVVDFGIQIMEYKSINFTRTRTLWDEIIDLYYNKNYSIEMLIEHYKHYQNTRLSHFRRLCPLDVED